MKVLHLISGGDTGGAKTHIISLVKGLDRIIDPKVICFIGGEFYEDAKEAGIDIEVYSQKNRFDLSVVKDIANLINDKDYDIVHCHGARANFLGMFLKSKINIPLITTIHSDYKLDFKDNFYKNIVFTTLNTLALKSCDYYIAISDEFKDMLIKRGFNGDDIYTAYNGIDFNEDISFTSKEEFLDRYDIDYKGKTIIGILARLDQVKDHKTFIKAANLVLKNNKDVIFLLAGDGFEKKILKNMVKNYGIEDYVYFLNYIKDPYSFLNAIDINVLTSLSESFPYVILEGARMKKTIISTNVGGLDILVDDGYNGYLIDIGDEVSLKDKLNSLIDNKDKIREMGENLYRDVKERFSSNSMAEKHVKIYREVLQREERNYKKVLLSGYYGFDNSGDDAILKAIIKDLKEKDKNIDITVLSKDPKKTSDHYKVKAVNRFKMKEVIRATKSTSLLISGGGSLLQDVTSSRSLWYYLILMYLSRIYKKKIMVYANGIGPINKKFNRFLSKKILNRVNLITLRDENSKIYLQDMGVNNKNIFVTADPVFTLEPSKEDRVKEIFKDENISISHSYIGISIRNWKNTENLELVIGKTIEYILDKYNTNIIIIPMHHPEDLEISLKIQERVNRDNCYTLRHKYNVEDIMGITKSLDLILAMRLHSLIYAATQEVPMVGIVYDPKVEGMLKSFDIEYMCPVENLKFEDLIYNVDQVWEKKEEIRINLKKQDEKFIEKALLNVTMALELLELGG